VIAFVEIVAAVCVVVVVFLLVSPPLLVVRPHGRLDHDRRPPAPPLRLVRSRNSRLAAIPRREEK